MLFEENIRIAASQLRAGKMRSFLTTLGITIGVGTVIFIVSILEGYNQSITSELNILGANTFQVQRNDRFTGIGHGRDAQKYRKIIKLEIAQAIRDNCDMAEAAGAEVWDFGLVVGYKDKKTNPNMQVAGGEPEFFVNNSHFTSSGRIFTPEDVNLHRKIIVLGMDAVEVLFPQEDPLGKEVKLVGTKFEVVGVLEKKGSATFGQSQDNLVIIPITTFEDLWGKFRSVNITVRVKEGVDFEDAQSQVIGVVRKERGVPPGEENDFTIFSNDTLIEEFNGIASKVTLVGILLGAISLLVGSIGVMNIMLVTVTERTREIGIRKAVGAKKSIILTQFLIEAVALSLIGGIVGMMLGFGLAAGIGFGLKIPFAVPLWVVIISLGVTSMVGLAAGLYPAARAARMDPINALRYE
jgi:putative ABC transport system permease protein